MHPNEQLGWQEFHAKKKEGDKKCLSCYKEFVEAGYPNKGSWLCDVFCWNMWQLEKPMEQDTISNIQNIIDFSIFDDIELSSNDSKFAGLKHWINRILRRDKK